MQVIKVIKKRPFFWESQWTQWEPGKTHLTWYEIRKEHAHTTSKAGQLLSEPLIEKNDGHVWCHRGIAARWHSGGKGTRTLNDHCPLGRLALFWFHPQFVGNDWWNASSDQQQKKNYQPRRRDREKPATAFGEMTYRIHTRQNKFGGNRVKLG